MKRGENKDGGQETPLYKLVSAQLAEDIKENYRSGDVLPAEQELMKQMNINRYTLRMAIEDLVNQGLVGRYQGKGTVVQQQLITYPIHADTRYTEILESSGRLAESVVLRKIGVPAHKEVAVALKVEVAEPVIHIETLRKMDGAPFSLSSHYFPLKTMFEVMTNYEAGSLHELIFASYGIKLKRVESLISAILPTPADAALLEVAGNSPLLRVKSVNVDAATAIPVEFVVSRFKGISTELLVRWEIADGGVMSNRF